MPKTCSSESRNSLSHDFTHVLSHGVSCSIEIGSIDFSRSSESCFASLPLRNARIVLLSHPPAFVASRFMGNCPFRQFSNMKNILPAWSCVTRIVFSSPFASRIGISVFSFFRVTKKADRFLISICLCIGYLLFGSSSLFTKGKRRFYICVLVQRKIAVWVAKKPDIFGLFAGDIFFVSTLWSE